MLGVLGRRVKRRLAHVTPSARGSASVTPPQREPRWLLALCSPLVLSSRRCIAPLRNGQVTVPAQPCTAEGSRCRTAGLAPALVLREPAARHRIRRSDRGTFPALAAARVADHVAGGHLEVVIPVPDTQRTDAGSRRVHRLPDVRYVDEDDKKDRPLRERAERNHVRSPRSRSPAGYTNAAVRSCLPDRRAGTRPRPAQAARPSAART
jgi:hypothetical protein